VSLNLGLVSVVPWHVALQSLFASRSAVTESDFRPAVVEGSVTDLPGSCTDSSCVRSKRTVRDRAEIALRTARFSMCAHCSYESGGIASPPRRAILDIILTIRADRGVTTAADAG